METQTTPLEQAKWSPRKRLLYDHLMQEGYVCDVGRDYARNDTLLVTELEKGQSVMEKYDQTASGVRALLQRGSSGLIVILPEEPTSYEALKIAKEKCHTDIVTAVIETEIFDHRSKVEKALAELPTKEQADASPKGKNRRSLTAISAPFILQQLQHTSGSTGSPTADSHSAIHQKVETILRQEPNALPMYGERGLFTITLSSAYCDEHEKERKKAREYFGIENTPHQRWSPVTCLFVNWHDEIARVMKTKVGESIQRKKVLSPFFLDPNESLAKPYQRFDAAFDQYILMNYQMMRTLFPPGASNPLQGILEELEKQKIRTLYQTQHGLLLARQQHLRGEISNEEFEKRCVQWDIFIATQMKEDAKMLRLLLNKKAGGLQKPKSETIDTIRPIRRTEQRIGRNDPCSCGSGKKFKHCCGGKH